MDQIKSLTDQNIQMANQVESLTATVAEFNQYVEVMEQTAQQLQAMSPIEITMGMLSNNVSWSVILSLPIALLTRRNKPEQGE